MRILIISLSDLGNDPRVYRQLLFLRQNHSVTCMGLADPCLEGVEYIHVPLANRRMAKVRVALAHLARDYRSLARHSPTVLQPFRDEISARQFDVIVANDFDTLSFAFAVKGRAKIVLDATEYGPREFEDVLSWRLIQQPYVRYLCRHYLPRCDAVLTVCDGLADEYGREFGVRPDVIFNSCEYHDRVPSPVDPGRIRLVHHGVAVPSRRIERMIEMMDHVDGRFSLDLMLVPAAGSEEYYRRLAELCGTRQNVALVPPVAMNEIVATLNPYDIGLFLLEPTNFNYANALPNKLFEFVQARLAIAIGPSPEMARIVRRFDCGVVAGSFSPADLASSLDALSAERIEEMKIRACEAAPALAHEETMKVFESVLERITS